MTDVLTPAPLCGNPERHNKMTAGGWQCPDCEVIARDRHHQLELQSDKRAMLTLLESMEKRMIRLETRNTNALRFLGLRPGEPVPDPGKGRVAVFPDGVYATGLDVTVADISHALAMSNLPSGEIPLYVSNVLFGTLTIKEKNHD